MTGRYDKNPFDEDEVNPFSVSCIPSTRTRSILSRIPPLGTSPHPILAVEPSSLLTHRPQTQGSHHFPSLPTSTIVVQPSIFPLIQLDQIRRI